VNLRPGLLCVPGGHGETKHRLLEAGSPRLLFVLRNDEWKQREQALREAIGVNDSTSQSSGARGCAILSILDLS
jgi:hypothetical protein